MAYAFNEDKSKYDINSVLSELQDNINELLDIEIDLNEISTNAIEFNPTIPAGQTIINTGSVSFDIPNGYIPIAVTRYAFNAFLPLFNEIINAFKVDFVNKTLTITVAFCSKDSSSVGAVFRPSTRIRAIKLLV